MILPIDVERVPYRFNVELAEELFDFEVHYNGAGDYFTVDLRKNGEDVVSGEKITYGVPLFYAYTDARLPAVTITARDEAGIQNRVSRRNLGETVFLEVVE